MSVATVVKLGSRPKFLHQLALFQPLFSIRTITSRKSGALLPKPKIISFGLIRVVIVVVPGLFIGAGISKTMANFLEENDLFVPSDDDDEDD